MREQRIIVVSGLPRSGTSMMMQMLQAGGVGVVSDNLRKPDQDNPAGYYELERAKQLATDPDAAEWLGTCQGKAIKLISELLFHLPKVFEYDVIFMRRPIEEIIASQDKMLRRLGTATPTVAPDELRRMLLLHLDDVMEWLEKQPNLRRLYLNYKTIVATPEMATARLSTFLDRSLTAMTASAVQPALYRNRQ